MARLPEPGNDKGVWGDILNEFLSISIDSGGFLKENVVNTVQIADTAVTESKLSLSVQTKLNALGETGTFEGTLDDIEQGTNNRHFSSADKTKLDTIASGATANSSDAALVNRTNHTGTQTASTISDFTTAVDDRIAATPDLVRTSGLQSALDGKVSTISVITGNEARPQASVVFWIGGSTEPINMAIGDVWLETV